MKYIYSLSLVILFLFSCSPSNEISPKVKRDLAITVSTEVGNGTYNLVGEATGRVQRTDAFLSISVGSYHYEHFTPPSMMVLFNNIKGMFFYNPSTIEEFNQKYAKYTIVWTILVTRSGKEVILSKTLIT